MFINHKHRKTQSVIAKSAMLLYKNTTIQSKQVLNCAVPRHDSVYH